MTGELLLASVVIGLSSAWLAGVVMGTGQYGLLGDLSLGLIGGCVAVWIYQAVGLAAYAGNIGAIMAALIGAVGILLAQRKLRFLVA
jgi:uncharacterized membrane protein YeaQ/YmgE (transglycosylase-associated protein family)